MMIYTSGPKVKIIYTNWHEFVRCDWAHHRDIYMHAMAASEDVVSSNCSVEELLWKLANVNGNSR